MFTNESNTQTNIEHAMSMDTWCEGLLLRCWSVDQDSRRLISRKYGSYKGHFRVNHILKP